MKLFLASRFHHENTQKKLSEYIGGFKGKKIAYIPTASNGESGWEDWKQKEDGSWRFINTLEAIVDPIVLEDYRNNSVVKKLENVDMIWFAGGVPGYLMYWIRRCEIDLHIKELLETSIFFGTSAGAMVAGQTLQIATFGFVDGERGADDIKPMGLVDFDIFPHYQDELLSDIKNKYTGKKIYLLKDGEEIIVEDGKVEVIGEERIITND